MFLKKDRQGTSIAIRGTVPGLRAREVITPSSGIVRVKFPSRKNGRMVHAEGLLEAHSFYWLEAASEVLEYQEQPFSIHFRHGDRLRRYTPDLEVVLDGDRRIVVEIKPSSSLKRSEVFEKLRLVKQHFAEQEIEYQVWTDQAIRQEPWLSNLRWLYSKARNQLATQNQKYAALRFLEKYLPTSLDHAEKLLEKVSLEPYSLIYDGILKINLGKPISLNSTVSLEAVGEQPEIFRKICAADTVDFSEINNG